MMQFYWLLAKNLEQFGAIWSISKNWWLLFRVVLFMSNRILPPVISYITSSTIFIPPSVRATPTPTESFMVVTMTTFLPPHHLPKLPSTFRKVPRCAVSPLPLDPLPAFVAFCQRNKTTLSTQTAEADGLGTFTMPFCYPPTNHQTTSLNTGRRFRASIDVFRSPPYKHQSAGLALKLIPHDPTLPSLRADVHYFQTNTSWWFSGACDLSAGPAGKLSPYTSRFLKTWHVLRERYRAKSSATHTSFLESCYGSCIDRETAFGFVGDVVEGFLPAYLPLLLENIVDGENILDGETCESFCITGGAACESSTLLKGPFVSWSFSLAPSALTAAGRIYDTLREGDVSDLRSPKFGWMTS